MGGSPAEEASFAFGEVGHGGLDSQLDAGPFAFGHAAEEGHEHVVGFGVGVDPATYFGYPQLDSVVFEDREGVGELVGVERPGRFAYYHRVPPAAGSLQLFEEQGCLGPAVPGQGEGVADIEELGHNDPAVGFDELPGPA